MENLLGILLIINFILLVGLLILIQYETRQAKNSQTLIEKFIDAHSEIFGVVNTNASVSQELADRLLVVEKNSEFFKVIIDAHAHVLRIYAPSLKLLDDPVTDKLERIENF